MMCPQFSSKQVPSKHDKSCGYTDHETLWKRSLTEMCIRDRATTKKALDIIINHCINEQWLFQLSL